MKRIVTLLFLLQLSGVSTITVNQGRGKARRRCLRVCKEDMQPWENKGASTRRFWLSVQSHPCPLLLKGPSCCWVETHTNKRPCAIFCRQAKYQPLFFYSTDKLTLRHYLIHAFECLYDRMHMCLQNACLSAFEFFVVPICSTQAYQKCL